MRGFSCVVAGNAACSLEAATERVARYTLSGVFKLRPGRRGLVDFFYWRTDGTGNNRFAALDPCDLR